MAEDTGSRTGGQALDIAKRVVPWLVLAVLVLWVFNMYSAYRVRQSAWDAVVNKPKPSSVVSTTTAKTTTKTTTKPAAKPPVKPVQSKVLVVAGVNFRKDPSDTSEVIRTLSEGEKLALVGQVGSWYKVTDSTGAVGWVSASQKYTKIIDK